MNRGLLIFLLCLSGLSAMAQGRYDRKRKDIIPLEGQAKRIGWFVAPGLTYTMPPFSSEEEEVYNAGDSSYTTTYDPNGRLGFYIEGGLSWYTRDPVVVDYLGLGVAYKNLRGAESYAGTLQRGDTITPVEGEGDFAERLLSFSFNANKFIPTVDYQFVQLSLGANVDYRLGSDYAHTGDPLLNGHAFPPDLMAQLHFKLGYGFKLTGNLILIPAIETPIFSIVPEDEGFGELQWFSSQYRPIIFSVRFLFLRARDGFDCPPPIKHNEFEKSRTVDPKPPNQ